VIKPFEIYDHKLAVLSFSIDVMQAGVTIPAMGPITKLMLVLKNSFLFILKQIILFYILNMFVYENCLTFIILWKY